jgi:hypothetical protein
VLNWEAAYGKAYQLQVSDNATAWTTIYSTTTGAGGVETLTVAGTGRYVRMLGVTRGTAYGYSLWEFQVTGTIGTAATLLSQGKPATASSVEGALVAANAVDGNTGTRLGSAFSDPQWLQVDLGATSSITKVVLNWEAAYGKAYQIQVTDNPTGTWNTVYSTTAGVGGVETLNVTGSGRYPHERDGARHRVMGMGFATLHPTAGTAALTVADVDGVRILHLLVDAGATNSPVLVQVGPTGSSASHAGNPTVVADVLARVGGAGNGSATVAMQVNSNNVIVDHTWLWRADHGAGAGWTTNPSLNGLVVNGQNVTAYGLFVEHFQQHQVLWNGNGGRTCFYQSEIPYDPPDQASWSAPGVLGWPSYKVANTVTSHQAYGMGIYSVFTNANVYLSNAIECPSALPAGSFQHLITVNLTANGGINNVIDNTGGATPPGIAVGTPKVTSYP